MSKERRMVHETVEHMVLGSAENYDHPVCRIMPWIDYQMQYYRGGPVSIGVQFIAGSGFLDGKVFDFELWSGRWVAVPPQPIDPGFPFHSEPV